MRKRWILVIAVALLAISAQPVSAATVNYRIADSTSELQNGTLSNARVDTERDTVRPGTYDDTLEHRYRFESGTTDVVGSDDLSGSSSAATGIAGNGRALDSGDTLSFSDSHASEYAISLWVKPSSEGLIYDDSHIEIGYFNGGLSVSEAGGDEVVSLGSISSGEWTQISVHVDSGGQGSSVQATAFRDGQFEGTISQLGYLGETPTLGADNFAGTIDELRASHGGTPGEMARLGSAPEAPASGDPALAERWAFDAGVDSVAYGDDGDDATLQNGAGWASGPSGQALSLDGTDDHATAPHSSADLSGDDSWTISARVRWDGGNSNSFSDVINLGDTEVRLSKNDNDEWFLLFATENGAEFVSEPATQGEWVHLVGRLQNDELTLWVDGVEVASTATTATPRDTLAKNGIGSTPTGALWSGLIDEVRVYERGLSDAEIGYLADHPGAELARGDRLGQSYDADASTGYADFRSLENATARVKWQGYDGSSWGDIKETTYSTAGNKSVSLPEGEYERYRSHIFLAPTDPEYRAELDATGVSFAGSAPTLSDPQPTGTITSFDGDLEINVSDLDFGDSEGDEVTVTASNQNGEIGSTTVTQNGTASISYDALAGENEISWSATDSYGDSAPDPPSQQFTTPANLTVFRETDNSTKIRNATVTIRFYPVGDDEAQVVTRSTTNGSINLVGLPADQPFVAVANVSGYESRRIFFRDLYEQQRIYLLNDSVESAETIFQVRDYTGRFPPDNTVLEIRRSINGSWRTVSGDYFGASAQYPATLDVGARYQLRLYNPETEATRQLGTYQPIVAQTQTIEVSPDSDIEDIQVLPVATIRPQTRRVPALNDTQLSASLSQVENVTVDSWRVTVIRNSTTISNQTYDGSTRQANLTADLGGYAGEEVTISVVATLSDGRIVSAGEATLSVYESPTNQLSLLTLVTEFVGLSAPGTAGALTSFLAAVLTVFVMAGTSTQLPVSGETTALVGVLTLTGFSVIGWVGYGVVFVSGSAVVAFAALRRGL